MLSVPVIFNTRLDSKRLVFCEERYFVKKGNIICFLSSSRPTSGRSKTPLWTREGLKKSQVSDSSDSEKSTPVSSLSGSVKVEERSGSGQEKESTPEVFVHF